MPHDESTLPWGQHPLISAVLWALGTNQTNTALGEDANRLRSTSSASTTPVLKNSTSTSSIKERISWKDEQGGDINEFHTLTMSQKENIKNNGSQSTSGRTSTRSSSSTNKTSPPKAVVDRAVVDLHTQVNTFNNAHHNIYGEQREQALVLQARRFETTASQDNHHQTPSSGAQELPLSSPSPNWGFFVSMTPPQQDAFAKST